MEPTRAPVKDPPRSLYGLTKERLRALAGWERWLERPMQWLSVLWLVLVIIELTGPPSRTVQWIATSVWALFVLDFLLRLALAPDKQRYLKRNILTAVSLVVPAARLFRLRAAASVLRLGRGLRLARVVGSINRAVATLQQVTRRGAFHYVVLLTAVVTLVGSAGIYALEEDAGGAKGISDFWTALWWTSMIMTTMGSEYWPQTPEGRVLTVFLALYAFAVFGYVTATLARFLIGRDMEQGSAVRISDSEVAALIGELSRLRATVEEGKRSPASKP